MPQLKILVVFQKVSIIISKLTMYQGALNAKICGRPNIVKTDIKDMTELFMDAKSSAAMLKENSAKYMM